MSETQEISLKAGAQKQLNKGLVFIIFFSIKFRQFNRLVKFYIFRWTVYEALLQKVHFYKKSLKNTPNKSREFILYFAEPKKKKKKEALYFFKE